MFGSDAPKRVITLAPSLAEIVGEILEPSEWSRVVGVSEFTTAPAGLANKPKVGPFHRAHLEAVVGLKPDLVLATKDGNSADQVSRLRELGIRVETVDTRTLEDVASSMRMIGRALGMADQGERVAQKFWRNLTAIRVSAADQSRVIIQLAGAPMVAAGQSFVSEAVDLLGFKNVFSDLRGYPRPSVEEIIRRNPQVVICIGLPQSQEGRVRSFWSNLASSTRPRVVWVRGDQLLRPSPSLIEGLLELRNLTR